MLDFKQYIKELQSVSLNEITEHSKRFALETLLRELASGSAAANTNNIKILHEPKRKDNYGSPDFKIYTNDSIIGYVENKKITENLDKTLKSDQIKKYRELSQNILLTNYIEFVWIKGEMVQREMLCYVSDIENKKFKLDIEKCEKVEKLLTNFFSQAPQQIANPKDLAIALAIRSKNLKDYLSDSLTKQNDENKQAVLLGLYKSFKKSIFNELSVSEFSDAFAQMLVYGLFLAKLNADTKTVSLENAKKYIPTSFQLIKELVGFLDELENNDYKETKWIIDETISIMNNLNLFEIKRQLSFSKKIKDNENIETDPYIYFYETFLSAYDSKLRKAKGVYYTPPQVVNFIIRAVNDILKDEFNITGGFAARNNVTVLDFATGTGTFLVEIFKQIIETLPADSKAKRDFLIKEHILKNIYGFEYLIAPYTIAHLKLSQFLKENNYELTENERLQIFLTNTFEPVYSEINLFVPQLSQEGEQAQKIKEKPILVITGNPPYSYISKNNGEWITNKIKDYYQVDGKSIGEKNPKGLQDDYVKFIRFAQDKMGNVEQGVIGIITNHSFLDNPTFKGMRQSLLNTFDQMYFIDLHGNAKKKEKTPNGEKDENVFDIEQGVAISIFVKNKKLEKKIYYSDFWGKRLQKYDLCLSNSLNTINWQQIKFEKPFYLFKPVSQENLFDKNSKSIPEIFNSFESGVKTHDDENLVCFTEPELIENIKNKYPINLNKSLIKDYQYRPFDKRLIYYDTNLVKRARKNQNAFFQSDNLGIMLLRQSAAVGSDVFNSVFVVNQLVDTNLFRRGGPFIFPLYIFINQGIFHKNEQTKKYITEKEHEFQPHKQSFEVALTQLEKHEIEFNKIKKPTQADKDILEEHRTTFEQYKKSFEQIKKQYEPILLKKENIELFDIENPEIIGNGLTKIPNFKKEFQNFINSKYTKKFTPEQILGYIYAVSPTYRIKYAEFLNIDFPKIPFCDDVKQFEILSEIGITLIDYHLLKKEPSENEFQNIGDYKGDGDNVVLKPEYKTIKTENGFKGMLYINKTQFFDNISENVNSFSIGGYQILDKYLKDRKNRKLSFDEVETFEKTIKVISFTINQMKVIDKETKTWI